MITKNRFHQRLDLIRLVSVIWAIMGAVLLIGCVKAAADGDLSELMMIPAGIWYIAFAVKKARKIHTLKADQSLMEHYWPHPVKRHIRDVVTNYLVAMIGALFMLLIPVCLPLIVILSPVYIYAFFMCILRDG